MHAYDDSQNWHWWLITFVLWSHHRVPLESWPIRVIIDVLTVDAPFCCCVQRVSAETCSLLFTARRPKYVADWSVGQQVCRCRTSLAARPGNQFRMTRAFLHLVVTGARPAMQTTRWPIGGSPRWRQRPRASELYAHTPRYPRRWVAPTFTPKRLPERS